MTPNATSSPILLLNASTDAANRTATNSAEPADGEALSGFELLLSAVSQTQFAAKTSVLKTTNELQQSNAAATDNGNALPLTGLILPLPDLKVDAGAAEHSKPDESDAQKSDATVAVVVDPALLANVPVAPIVTQNSAAAAPPINNGGAADAAIASALAVSAAVNDKSGLATPKNSRQDQKPGASAITLDLGTTNTNDAHVSSPSINTRATADAQSALPVVADSDGDAVLRGAAEKSVGAVDKPAAKNSGESDFDALIKHFDATAPSAASTPVPTTNDSTRVHSPSRAYADVGATTTVSTPVGSSGWGDAVADKVMWLSASKMSSAEIHLNPPDLGPLQVRVSTQHDQASVLFTSQHAAVRDALDQALPRLREMMGNQGMHLLDVSVGGQGAQQQPQQQFGRNDGDNRSGGQFSSLFSSDEGTESAVHSVSAVNAAQFTRSGVDAYV